MKYVVYLTEYKGDKLPPFYIGSTSLEKINSGYKGSVKSKKWKGIYEREIRENPALFYLSIISEHESREDALREERKIQIERDVIKSNLYFNESIAAPNGFFGMDVSGENNPFYNKQHNEELQNRIAANIKKTMSDPEWKERFSAKQKEVQNQEHNRIRNSIKQKEAQNRSEVIERRNSKMNELRTNHEFIDRHKKGCQTEDFRNSQRKFREGKKWINNEQMGKQKYVKIDELENYMLIGWSIGMLKRKNKDG
jgi:hypothetical protein